MPWPAVVAAEAEADGHSAAEEEDGHLAAVVVIPVHPSAVRLP